MSRTSTGRPLLSSQRFDEGGRPALPAAASALAGPDPTGLDPAGPGACGGDFAPVGTTWGTPGGTADGPPRDPPGCPPCSTPPAACSGRGFEPLDVDSPRRVPSPPRPPGAGATRAAPGTGAAACGTSGCACTPGGFMVCPMVCFMVSPSRGAGAEAVGEAAGAPAAVKLGLGSFPRAPTLSAPPPCAEASPAADGGGAGAADVAPGSAFTPGWLRDFLGAEFQAAGGGGSGDVSAPWLPPGTDVGAVLPAGVCASDATGTREFGTAPVSLDTLGGAGNDPVASDPVPDPACGGGGGTTAGTACPGIGLGGGGVALGGLALGSAGLPASCPAALAPGGACGIDPIDSMHFADSKAACGRVPFCTLQLLLVQPDSDATAAHKTDHVHIFHCQYLVCTFLLA